MNVLVLLLLIGSDVALSQSGERGVREVQKAAMQAWNAGDLELLMSHYAEDAVIMVAGMPAFEGIDAIRMISRGGIEAGTKLLSLEVDEVWTSHDLAVIRARYVSESPGKKGPNRASGHLLAALRYDGERWRIAAESWTPSD